MHILVPYSSGCAAVCPGVFRLQVDHGNLQEKVRQDSGLYLGTSVRKLALLALWAPF